MKDIYLEAFVLLIIFLKFIYSCIYFYVLYLNTLHKGDVYKIDKYSRYESIIELIVLLCLAILIIILFDPRDKGPVVISYHMKHVLFLLAIVLLFTIEDFRKKLKL